MEEYYEDFDFDPLHMIVDEQQRLFTEKYKFTTIDPKEKIVQSEVLSQKLSQLSSDDANQQLFHECLSVDHHKRPLSTTSTPDVATKKMREWNSKAEANQEAEQVSKYFERINEMFDIQMKDDLGNSIDELFLDDLRELAILKHRIIQIELDKQLWTIYLKVGKGEWITSESKQTNVDRRLWPAAVKKLCTTMPNVSDINQSHGMDREYERIVQQHIEEFYEKIECYSMEYHEKKTSLLGFTDEIQQTLERFVHQYSITPFRMKLNYKIRILEYNYGAQLLEHEYLQQKPTANQIRIAKHIYDSATAYTKAKQELNYLKQRIVYNKPTTLIYKKALLLAPSSTADSTSDATRHQLFMDGKEKDLQQHMTNLIAEAIGKAETKMIDRRNAFNKEMTRMSTPNEDKNEKFSTELVDLIHRRSPASFPLTETLATLYVLSWFKSLFRQTLLEKEFYGRYKNQVFFTWNNTNENLIRMIKASNVDDININLDMKIGSSAQFLQVYMENQNGTLYSRVHHDSMRQKYTVPYVIGSTKEAHSRWLRAALIRAVRFCSSVYDFNQERIYLEVSCLANGYTMEFVEKRVEQFFSHFDALSLRSDLDQQVYNKLRHRLLNFVSEQKRMHKKYQDLAKANKRFRISYLHDFGPKRQFNEELREIFSRNLNVKDPLSNYRDLQLIFSTKNPHTLNALLSQYKPSHPLLTED
ncbi:unnamed protein product [Rotaria sp. Silwood1]|nr:unnamed protein product [Rotaria sp. Silwood1]CAF1613907.1 unnamed protein product [Rotaria sp. Silwood1]CAF3691600.1 unnamed protein product [Rotaria sp. Silwood1]CAF3740568.1 unnamed protein product [Rotaria sp. Silwood1]CAF3751863.1 unnamed protein product [Rotaria sp. Silwood1]